MICRTNGGFADTLSQIMRCLKYCITYNRKLIIDTIHNKCFADDIHNYFNISHSHIYNGTIPTYTELSVYPTYYTLDNIFTVGLSWCHTVKKSINKKYPRELIDFSINYAENILISGEGGGGNDGIEFLSLFKPKTIIIDELKKRYNSIVPKYLGLHIRNTDYKSDVPSFLEKMTPLIERYDKTFVASDNPVTIDEIKALFGDKIVTFSYLPSFTHPQHNIHRDDNTKFIIDLLCDLYLLILSDQCHCSIYSSGYSRMANRLNRTSYKDDLLKLITGE